MYDGASPKNWSPQIHNKTYEFMYKTTTSGLNIHSFYFKEHR